MRVNYPLVFIIVTLLSIRVASGEDDNLDNNKVESDGATQVLAAPYFTASSDEGFMIGGMSSFAKPPAMLLYLYGFWSTENYTGITVRGELDVSDFRLIGKTHLSRIERDLYPEKSDGNDVIGSAKIDMFQVQLALMSDLTPNLEAGPELILDFIDGSNVKDRFGRSTSDDNFQRFRRGSLVHLGLRSRYKTTSALRPVDGVIIDGGLSAGRSGGAVLNSPQFDWAGNLSLALAQPVSPRLRFYVRGKFNYQDKATPPVQNPLGGDLTLRGLPTHRDYGLRVWNGRSQLHYTILKDWAGLFKTAHEIWNLIPFYRIDVETVGFLDIGAAGDPNYGWRKTRHGYGGGVRIVLPPEMTFKFDIATSPGGGLRFYIGAGETL